MDAEADGRRAMRWYQAIKGRGVVDVTGAGDTFLAALFAARLEPRLIGDRAAGGLRPAARGCGCVARRGAGGAAGGPGALSRSRTHARGPRPAAAPGVGRAAPAPAGAPGDRRATGGVPAATAVGARSASITGSRPSERCRVLREPFRGPNRIERAGHVALDVLQVLRQFDPRDRGQGSGPPRPARARRRASSRRPMWRSRRARSNRHLVAHDARLRAPPTVPRWQLAMPSLRSTSQPAGGRTLAG